MWGLIINKLFTPGTNWSCFVLWSIAKELIYAVISC
jgi:hypothetical protein